MFTSGTTESPFAIVVGRQIGGKLIETTCLVRAKFEGFTTTVSPFAVNSPNFCIFGLKHLFFGLYEVGSTKEVPNFFKNDN